MTEVRQGTLKAFDNTNWLATVQVTGSLTQWLRSRDELSMEADVEDDRVRVRMSDPGAGFDVHAPRPPSSGTSGGYGLVLLDRLSDRWGVQRDGRFSVWFEVQRDRLPFGDERRPRARPA